MAIPATLEPLSCGPLKVHHLIQHHQLIFIMVNLGASFCITIWKKRSLKSDDLKNINIFRFCHIPVTARPTVFFNSNFKHHLALQNLPTKDRSSIFWSLLINVQSWPRSLFDVCVWFNVRNLLFGPSWRFYWWS